MNARVLITGITGFAGQYLAPRLRDLGYEVIGTAHHDTDMDNVHNVDLRDAAQIKALVAKIEPTHVVHLAAIAFVAHENVSEIYDTNVVGTRNLLKALAELPQKPVMTILTSSANVYGNAQGAVSEDTQVNPANDYAVSKIAMEYMAAQFFDRLNIIIARPFNYTGRGQSNLFLVPKIVSHFKARADFIELGNTDVARDFSDVRTVMDYFVRMLQTPNPTERVFNICSGEALSLQSIIESCALISGHNLEIRVNPAFVRANEVKVLVGDPCRLHKSYGKIETAPFEETLAWMLKD